MKGFLSVEAESLRFEKVEAESLRFENEEVNFLYRSGETPLPLWTPLPL
jgi:hypothetical protein